MTDTVLLSLCLLLPVAGMILIPLLPHTVRSKANFLFVVLIAGVSSVPAVKALNGYAVDVVFHQTAVFGNIAFHIDSLSAWFILIINLTCINGAFYGIGYMKPYQAQKNNLAMHWILFLLFQSSMLWVCMVQNGLLFLVVWELMSISSFLLVIFEHQNKTTLQAGINYLVQMHIGVLFLTAAFIWVYFSTGSFEFSAIPVFFARHSNLWLFLLFFAGFGIKSGFIPLHTWLPQAHPAAPSHISGIMSGVIVKLGIYGIFRIVWFLKQDLTIIGEIVTVLSVMTALYGILNASVHRDFKKMLAYCTIENIGIIGIGIGLGLLGSGTNHTLLITLGFTAALLHTLNHSLFKSLLFFTAGSVYQQTHTRDMDKLGGLIKKMPVTAMMFLAGGMAIGGLPPFNGFVSEFILYNGLLSGIRSAGLTHISFLIFSFGALALTGGLSMLAFTKSFGAIFLGSPRTHLQHPPRETGLLMQLPQYFILIIMLSIALFPQFYFSITYTIAGSFGQHISIKDLPAPGSLLTSLSVTGMLSLLFLLLSFFVYQVRKRCTRPGSITTAPTWGCGYIAPTARMQYTGKSFSKSLGKLLNFIVLEKKRYREILPRETFPAGRKHSSHYNDFFVTRIFDRVIDRLLFSTNYFQFIQNGNIQMYILYGIFFIALIFFGTILKLV